MGNRKLSKMAKTVLALALAIMVILPSTFGKPLAGKTAGKVTIGSPISYGILGDDGEEYLSD